MDSAHSKEGFIWGACKEKRGLVFLGEEKNDEIWNINKNNASIINMYAVN